MGRRPNAVVGEFFHRGQKLDDNSNRYQHTCKKCGEHFVKGRIDSMLNHLMKRCPNMTQEDRNLAFLHMQHTSNGPGKAKKQTTTNNQANEHGAQRVRPSPNDSEILVARTVRAIDPLLEQQRITSDSEARPWHQVPQPVHHSLHTGQPTSVPHHMLMQRQQSALDTLAEVSRRQMHYPVPSQGYADPAQHNTTLRHDGRIVENELLAALQRQDASTYVGPTSVQPTDLPMLPTYIAPAQTGSEQTAFSNTPLAPSNRQSASVGVRDMNSYQSAPISAPVDAQSNETTSNEALIAPSHDIDAPPQFQSDLISWTERPQGFVTHQDPPSNDPNPDFGMLHKPEKTNARARFTDTRRRQVQELRKRGACMRCRMLKKPCSESTPCGTCKKIDSARLWTGTCLRTKLAEEFTLYSTSYFHSQMAVKFTNAKHALVRVPLPGRIEVELVQRSALVMTFNAKYHVSPSNPPAAEALLQTNTTAISAFDHDIVVLDDGMASQTVSDHCMDPEIRREFVINEKNTFLRATLLEATALLEAENSRTAPSDVKSGPRANHISPGILLSSVIDLWVGTNVLVRNSEVALEMRYNLNTHATSGPKTVGWTRASTQSNSAVPPNSMSYSLIYAQILAATETACHRLSKAVLNELERRLLQRQQVSAFATFVSAVILFSCMERITSFYYSLDPTSWPRNTGTTLVSSYDTRPPGYPESVPCPRSLWTQGPNFARLLTMLLRMRALPPRTARTADNKLAILQEPVLPVRLNGVAVREQQDSEAVRAAMWLDHLKLDADELRARRDGELTDECWDMRFISAVLLGEKDQAHATS